MDNINKKGEAVTPKTLTKNLLLAITVAIIFFVSGLVYINFILAFLDPGLDGIILIFFIPAIWIVEIIIFTITRKRGKIARKINNDYIYSLIVAMFTVLLFVILSML